MSRAIGKLMRLHTNGRRFDSAWLRRRFLISTTVGQPFSRIHERAYDRWRV